MKIMYKTPATAGGGYSGHARQPYAVRHAAAGDRNGALSPRAILRGRQADVWEMVKENFI
jgi:hypothetical protein